MAISKPKSTTADICFLKSYYCPRALLLLCSWTAAAAAVHVPAAAVLLLAPAGPLSAAGVLPSAAAVLYPAVAAAADWQSLLHPVQPKLLYEFPWIGAIHLLKTFRKSQTPQIIPKFQ